jgi:hypothetical protein
MFSLSRARHAFRLLRDAAVLGIRCSAFVEHHIYDCQMRSALLVTAATVALLLGDLVLPTVSAAASAPSIGAVSAEVGQNEATLKAPIRPEGLETKYEFWLQCTGSSCISTEGTRVGEGSIQADRLEQEVEVPLTSLLWNTSYDFEVVAANTDGTRHSYIQGFTTGSPPPAGCPDGCPSGEKYESKLEPWVNEGASREASEAPRIGAEEEAKAKEAAELPAKEAAARVTHEREIREAGEHAGREAAERQAKTASVTNCVVPRLRDDSLEAARRALAGSHCTLGKVSKPRRHHGSLRVTRQSSNVGKTLPNGAAVAVTLGSPKAMRG